MEAIKAGGMVLLPCAKDVCQMCAVKHAPTEAHNAQSLYYSMRFIMAHGRSPTWADAIAHCSPEHRAIWEKAIRAKNAWSEPAAGVAVIVEVGGV